MDIGANAAEAQALEIKKMEEIVARQARHAASCRSHCPEIFTEPAGLVHSCRSSDAEGQLDDWMIIRNGEKYCTLCSSCADEAHLSSQKHLQRKYWAECQRKCQGTCGGMMRKPTGPILVREAYDMWLQQLPDWNLQWGPCNPALYAWKAEVGCYFCKLCWKYVDDAHMASNTHQKRAAYPSYYLPELRDHHAPPPWTSSGASVQAGVPPPPPPPPQPAQDGQLALTMGSPTTSALRAASTSSP